LYLHEVMEVRILKNKSSMIISTPKENEINVNLCMIVLLFEPFTLIKD